MTQRRPDARRRRLSLPPDAITARGLRRAWRGYDRSAVEDLLARLARQTTELVEEVEGLRAEHERLQDRLSEVAETEDVLRRTLVTAQRAADESVREAGERAEEVRARALGRAEELLREAVDEAHDLRQQALARARDEESEARARRRQLEQHADALQAFARDHRERLARHLRRQLERLEELDLPTPPSAPAGDGVAADTSEASGAGLDDPGGPTGGGDEGNGRVDDRARVEQLVSGVAEDVYGDADDATTGDGDVDAVGEDADATGDDADADVDVAGGDADAADVDAEARGDG